MRRAGCISAKTTKFFVLSREDLLFLFQALNFYPKTGRSPQVLQQVSLSQPPVAWAIARVVHLEQCPLMQGILTTQCRHKIPFPDKTREKATRSLFCHKKKDLFCGGSETSHETLQTQESPITLP